MQESAFIRDLPFEGDTCTLFDRLSAGHPATVLLESQDGDGRNNTQSLLFVRSALRVECRGTRAVFTSLTPAGKTALEALHPHLAALAEVQVGEDQLIATFPPPPRRGTDSDRIKAPSTADALRLLSRGWTRTVEGPPLHIPGVFAYDFIEQFERLPAAKTDLHGFPDFVFYLPEEWVAVNHVAASARLVVHRYGARRLDLTGVEASFERMRAVLRQTHIDPEPLPRDTPAQRPVPAPQVDLDDDQFAALVITLKEHIAAGDVFQIVPSRTFRAPCRDPLAAYKELRRINPSPYLFFVRHAQFTLFGASPETCVAVGGSPRRVRLHPIAGTRPRGRDREGRIDPDADSRMEAALKLNAKELAEHMMLVDLARNDVARISRPGTRRVRRLMDVARYSQVMHLCSTVEGELRADLDGLHAYLASANMGTLVGAPKIEAAKLLRQHEPTRRGPYGGAVGYLTSDGSMDSCIVIRAALVHDGEAWVRAGAGVVFDSDPAAEAAETRAKANAVLRAVFQAQQSEP